MRRSGFILACLSLLSVAPAVITFAAPSATETPQTINVPLNATTAGSAVCSGTCYYVSAAGSDSNAGTSPSTAWLTVAHVNARSFNPGDGIFFRRGDTWNEQLIPPSSGSNGNPIQFGAYGSGAPPLFDGIETLYGWSSPTPNIYTKTGFKYIVAQLFRNGSRARQVATLVALAATGDWFYDGAGTLSIYSATNPALDVWLSSKIDSAINVNYGINYLTFTNLSVTRSRLNAINLSGSNIQLSSMIGSLSGSDCIGIGTNLVGQTITTVTITGGTLTNCGYVTGGDDNGIGTGGNGGPINNIMIDGVEIGGSAHDAIEMYAPPGSSTILVKNTYLHDGLQGGIRISGPGTQTATLHHNLIVNNSDHGIIINGPGTYTTFVYHNTIAGNKGAGVYAKSTNLTLKNNIIYNDGWSEVTILGISTSSILSDYNYIFKTGTSADFYLDNNVTFTQWKTNTGGDAHSVNALPMLCANYYLQPTSPAIGAGTEIPTISIYNPANIGNEMVGH